MIYSAREMTSCGGWLDKKCFICGKYFKTGESITLIIPSTEYKNAYKKLAYNVVAHTNEITELQASCVNDVEFLVKLARVRQPRAEKLTPEQVIMIQQFKQACYAHGLHETTDTKGGAKCKTRGSSDVLEYNVRTDRIDYRNGRHTRGMFDGLFERQLVTNIWNTMHEIRGDGQKDSYNVNELISNAVKKAEDIIGR